MFTNHENLKTRYNNNGFSLKGISKECNTLPISVFLNYYLGLFIYRVEWIGIFGEQLYFFLF